MALTLEDCHEIISKVCPELQTVNLVEDDTLVAPEKAEAWCSRGQHLALRDLLRKRGEWRGFGCGSIIFTQQPTLPHLIHEASHLLPAEQIELSADEEPTDSERKLQEAQIAAWVAEPRPAAVPWRGHSLPFIRCCLHLVYRVQQAFGDDALRLLDVRAGGAAYGLQSSAWDYQFALGTEPQRFLRKTFHEIAAEEPPPPFQRQFARDVKNWFSLLATLELEKCLPNNSTTE